MRRHAYLIIAHHEFELLALLLKTLDDARNDIFVHFDKNVTQLPLFTTTHAGLFMLNERIDVKWGDVSQIAVELLLFETAAKRGPYAYYHVLSGVDLPLKSQDEIHDFFSIHQGKEFIGFSQGDDNSELQRKAGLHHLFPAHFREQKGLLNLLRKATRASFIRLQLLMGFHRNQEISFKKGPNWVSVTDDFVRYLLEKKAVLMETYQHTFCADEIFLQTACWHSPFHDKVYDATDEGRGSMRLIGWSNNQLVDWKDEDFDLLMAAEALFARKFSSSQMGVVAKIVKKVTQLDLVAERNLPLVSVIIPVYNAAGSVGSTLLSLQRQTYTALEVIIINDCSTDDSLSVIARHLPCFADLGIDVKLINGEHNLGVAAARNKGLELSIGEFIYYVDADDYINADAIALLVQEAEIKRADIVGSNWYLSFAENERKMNQAAFSTPWEGIQNMLNGVMRWNLWLFLVRRSLYVQHKIAFTPGMNMGEDLMVMMRLFLAASRVSYLNQPLYHYAQTNEQSLTKVYSEAHQQEVTANVRMVERYLLESRYRKKVGHGIDFLKLNVKLPLLISDQEAQYEKWLSWFPESNAYVLANKSVSYRVRILQQLAAKKQFWALKLYFNVVIKFVYGKIYK